MLRDPAIGVFGRYDLALLGNSHAAVNSAGRLRRDGPTRGRAAATHRAAAPMKERHGKPTLFADLPQTRLRFGDFPVGAQESAVLVGVGIADHDLLHAAE